MTAPAHLYVATSDRPGVKIGRSVDPTFRMVGISRDLRAKANVFAQTEATAFADQAEALAHWALRGAHLGGEWFDVSPEVALSAALDAVAAAEAGEVAPQRINSASPFSERKGARLQLVISREDLEALDEWRASRKIFSRGAAVRQLISDGISREPIKPLI